LPITLNEVREKADLITRVKNLQFWEEVTPVGVEEFRNELRGLMRLLSPFENPIAGPRETGTGGGGTYIGLPVAGESTAECSLTASMR